MKLPEVNNQSQQPAPPPAYTPVAHEAQWQAAGHANPEPSHPQPQQVPTSALVGELFGRGLDAGFKAAKTAAVVGSHIIAAASKSSDPAPTPATAPSQQAHTAVAQNNSLNQPQAAQPPVNVASQQAVYPPAQNRSNLPQQYQSPQQPIYPPIVSSQPMISPSQPVPQPIVYQTQNAFVQQPGTAQIYPATLQPQIYPANNFQPSKGRSRPPPRPPHTSTTYWAPIYRSSAWKAVLYYLLINPVLGFFSFGYTLGTMVAGLALLIIYPIGLPMLYLFTITWRYLRKIEMHVLDWVLGIPFQKTSIWIDRTVKSDNPFEFMGELVWSHFTWDVVLNFVFVKPFRIVVNLLVAVLTVALGIPFVWCLPTLLKILEDAADGERMGNGGELSSSFCCCCCCATEFGSDDIEMGNGKGYAPGQAQQCHPQSAIEKRAERTAAVSRKKAYIETGTEDATTITLVLCGTAFAAVWKKYENLANKELKASIYKSLFSKFGHFATTIY